MTTLIFAFWSELTSFFLETSHIFWVFTLESWIVYYHSVQLPASRWGQILRTNLQTLVGLSKSKINIAWSVFTLLRVSFNRVIYRPTRYRVLRLSFSWPCSEPLVNTARTVNWKHRFVEAPVHSDTNQNGTCTAPPPQVGETRRFKAKLQAAQARWSFGVAGDPSRQPLVRTSKEPFTPGTGN